MSAYIKSLTNEDRKINDGLCLSECVDLLACIDDLSPTVCEIRAGLSEVCFSRISQNHLRQKMSHTSVLLRSHKITWSETVSKENDKVCQHTEFRMSDKA
jgi:hypothetical protein